MLKWFTYLELFCHWVSKERGDSEDPSSVNGQTWNRPVPFEKTTNGATSPNYQLSSQAEKQRDYSKLPRFSCSPLLSPWLFLYSFLLLDCWGILPFFSWQFLYGSLFSPKHPGLRQCSAMSYWAVAMSSRSTRGTSGALVVVNNDPSKLVRSTNLPYVCVAWISTQMGVSENRGTPKSSILVGFSIINHPFWGTSIFGNSHTNSLVRNG